MKNSEVLKNVVVEDFQKLGLYEDGHFKIHPLDLQELAAGRRTDFIDLKNLNHEGMKIESLKAKLSLFKNETGKFSLRVHPVYLEPQNHPLLSKEEMNSLITSERENVIKSYVDDKGKTPKMIIEFDKETNEFVSLNTHRMLIPDKVNNQELSPVQKEKLKEGEGVELEDGTVIQNSPTARKGFRSNANYLILSILVDGGISYLVIEGAAALLKAGRNNANDQAIKSQYTKGFQEGMKEMEEKVWARRNSNTVNFADDHHKMDIDELKRQKNDPVSSQKNSEERIKQESRGYGRGGAR